MVADDLRALQEMLNDCTDPRKCIALVKRIKALEAAIDDSFPVQERPDDLPAPDHPADATQAVPVISGLKSS